MALALSSTATCAFGNPIQAVITRVAEISVVGLDKRAIRNSIAECAPQHIIGDAVRRVAQHVVMKAEADVAPKQIGDVFDPLNIGSSDNFGWFREAEIKHGRLAMMAAVAWPLQEIINPIVTDILRASGIDVKDVLVESNGASPSVLNGGLSQWEVFPSLLFFVAVTEQLERSDLNARKELGCAWNEIPNPRGEFGRQPGNYRFDPLNIYRPLPADEKKKMQERELLNGRVAMMAVVSYVATEFLSQQPVVVATPALFQPLFMNAGFMEFMDASFGPASMARAAADAAGAM